MSNTVQRYDLCQHEEDWAWMRPDSDGDWVEYEEYARITEALRGEIRRLQTELSVKENPNGWK